MPILPDRDRMMAFLNALPHSSEAALWLNEFKTALQGLYREIDHVTVFYNLLDEKHRNTSLNWANMQLTADTSTALGFSADVVPLRLQERIEGVIDLEVASLNRSRAYYHPPTVRSYVDGFWLGSILLMR